uniref:Uncharacterized protein n=1 Tax=Strigamia maritima TaxID=126957 RepID=T1JHH1_STRMM
MPSKQKVLAALELRPRPSAVIQNKRRTRITAAAIIRSLFISFEVICVHETQFTANDLNAALELRPQFVIKAAAFNRQNTMMIRHCLMAICIAGLFTGPFVISFLIATLTYQLTNCNFRNNRSSEQVVVAGIEIFLNTTVEYEKIFPGGNE